MPDSRGESFARPSDQITPKELFLNRRQFLIAAGVVSASAFLAACGAGSQPPSSGGVYTDTLTDQDTALNFNNYFEFSTSKSEVAVLAKSFPISPWTVEVGGLVKNPKTYTLEDLRIDFPPSEHTYRMRCVEAWSMYLPWTGFHLNELLLQASPLPEAKYVAFEGALKPDAMPGQTSNLYPWPYTEGLRLDEAMHDLTILATGLYGETLSPQNGAPLRLVVPWKYGFKGIKAITKITLTSDMPPTFWNKVAPNEYGFYANVNPAVNHPRWSQATETRLGESEARPTLLYNGYDEVAALYAGMDLKTNF